MRGMAKAEFSACFCRSCQEFRIMNTVQLVSTVINAQVNKGLGDQELFASIGLVVVFSFKILKH